MPARIFLKVLVAVLALLGKHHVVAAKSKADASVKVIVVPFRSGSQTMKYTLEGYGYKTFGMGDCAARYSCLHAVEQGLHEKIPWRQALQGFDATVGVPIAAHFENALEAFPEAQVVLIVRDLDAHARSWSNLNKLLVFIRTYLWFVPRLRVFGKTTKVMMDNNFFAGGPVDDPEHVKAVIANFTQKVKALVSPERLLVLNMAEENGLAKLTEFLNLPHEFGPLPRYGNKHQNEVKYRLTLAVVIDFIVLAVAILLYWKIGFVAVVMEAAMLYGLYQNWQF